jgi:hypothetical protein
MAIINRISIGLVIVGVAGVALTGGDPESAVRLGSLAAAAIGGLVGLVKEIVQTIRR